MYLSRLSINPSRFAQVWASNPYRVHQRLRMACQDEPRLLFRIEESDEVLRILAQSSILPDWAMAFNHFPVLQGLPEIKSFDIRMTVGAVFAFRLIGNPTVRRESKRIGLGKTEEQNAWLARQMARSGAEVLRCEVHPYRIQRSRKNEEKDSEQQTHLVVRFDGLILCRDADRLKEAVEKGVGPAKGYGCGLLSLAGTE